ncbi:hypothetical protein CL617_04725 [archaeon]|nr:hypothetical protein [archaeon]|tara:strand:+ start:7152 stop:7418 length:267 start_codon:yes stop_codon:yes gene_type:complete
MANELVEYYGTACPHCVEMAPLIEKLEKEEKIKIKKLEVWHNAANAKKFQEADNGFCGGVPFFINTKTGKKVCGSMTYAKLKAWAQGK